MIKTESNEIKNVNHHIIAIKNIFKKLFNKENILTLLYIILVYILLSVIGFITSFIIKCYENFIDDKNNHFSVVNIVSNIFTTDSFYIVLPCSGIAVICSIIIILSLVINIHNCIKNMDWETMV